MNEKFDQDEFGEVINSDKTFEAITEILEKHNAIIFGWTDEVGSHLDILIVLQPIQVGNLQRGMKGVTDLFVSIIGFGTFSFKINKEDLHHSYISEKLMIGGDITVDKITELVNEVKARCHDE